MSRYIIDTDKHMSPFDGIVMTTLGGLEDADRALESAYQRGLEDGKVQSERGCDGCRFEGIEIYLRPCSACRNAYPNQWTAKQTDDKIKVRDEVIWTQDENVAIVVTCVYTKNNMEWCDGVGKDGKVYSILTENARKTGGRFDIDKYLEEINRSKTDGIC